MSEIIIDGVNVKECEHHTNLTMNCTLMPLQNLVCNKNPNCYYKQLKRLEAENEQLKQENHAIKRALKDKNIVAIVEENERLKVQLDIDKNQINYLIDENKELNQYEQALEEIREIAKPKFVNGLSEEADIYDEEMAKIENIIDEVLDERI